MAIVGHSYCRGTVSTRVVLAVAYASALAAAWLEPLHGGTLVLYRNDTAAGATPEDPVPDGAVEWARLPIPETGHSIADGVAHVAPLAGVVLADGMVGWARVVDAAGDGLLLPNVGMVDEALVVTRLEGVAGDPVAVLDWSFTIPTFTEY